MRAVNIITLVLVIVGGLNWGLYAIDPSYDLVAAIGGGPEGALAKIVYGLVALSAIWQAVVLGSSMSAGQHHGRALRA
jgi:uncharacterized membrane protein YuzA (DUF378 family)